MLIRLIKGWSLEKPFAQENELNEKLERLDASHILGCIAWHFRRDHFSEGSLIADSVAEGHMLRMLKCYVDKLEQ